MSACSSFESLTVGSPPSFHPPANAALRTYYSIPEDRLKSSVTYEKTLQADRGAITG